MCIDLYIYIYSDTIIYTTRCCYNSEYIHDIITQPIFKHNEKQHHKHKITPK